MDIDHAIMAGAKYDRGDSINIQGGFTLVEMMVALFIFSLLSVAGVALLRGAVDSNEVTDAKLSDMAQMQRLVSLMEADLSQAIPRPHRDEEGGRVAAFISETGSGGRGFLFFSRGGQSNINNKPRSNMQRISYQLNEGRLERRQYETTDGGSISEPAELLDGISDLELRFRDKRGQWVSNWQTERLSDLPRAVELRFEQNGRKYRHVFLVGTGYL
ncbi:type II secretion system minor pseudopilin GspJ [Parasphingorhabdus cellanae]|uniref:Type II secretion system protein J n=1 Tax=Parasphingorhabdus cellanae TaxID=2806553 RepID=A0ABX7T318_9SPHN|nr:type II secretion system minor pseudopilin GspJ [Parasphingorhabdus cellanae]QTD55936.1 type II secretion system minor pseudopilin GspJ [Parasphingorhabdus cellanae]